LQVCLVIEVLNGLISGLKPRENTICFQNKNTMCGERSNPAEIISAQFDADIFGCLIVFVV